MIAEPLRRDGRRDGWRSSPTRRGRSRPLAAEQHRGFEVMRRRGRLLLGGAELEGHRRATSSFYCERLRLGSGRVRPMPGTEYTEFKLGGESIAGAHADVRRDARRTRRRTGSCTSPSMTSDATVAKLTSTRWGRAPSARRTSPRSGVSRSSTTPRVPSSRSCSPTRAPRPPDAAGPIGTDTERDTLVPWTPCPPRSH